MNGDDRGSTLLDAYPAFLSDLRTIAGEGAERSIAEAFEAHQAAVGRTLSEPVVARRLAATWAEYAESVQRAFADAPSRARVREALERCLGAVRDGLAGADIATLDEATVAALGQGLVSAAWLAAVAAPADGSGAGDTPALGADWTAVDLAPSDDDGDWTQDIALSSTSDWTSDSEPGPGADPSPPQPSASVRRDPDADA